MSNEVSGYLSAKHIPIAQRKRYAMEVVRVRAMILYYKREAVKAGARTAECDFTLERFPATTAGARAQAQRVINVVTAGVYTAATYPDAREFMDTAEVDQNEALAAAVAEGDPEYIKQVKLSNAYSRYLAPYDYVVRAPGRHPTDDSWGGALLFGDWRAKFGDAALLEGSA